MASLAMKSIRILMCRPNYFEVKYSINPWMNKFDRVNKPRAEEQWNTLRKTLERLGANVQVMEPKGAEQYPDIVFTANSAVVRNGRAYIANFMHPERKGEGYFYEQWFKINGFKTFVDKNVPFEGAGDALWTDKNRTKLFCGIGPRTDSRALHAITKFLTAEDDHEPFKIYGVRLIDPRFYHIDTCFCPLEDGLALYYPDAFADISRHNMSNELELINVSEADALRFACNAVVVGRNVVMHEGSEATAHILEKVGYTTHFVDMSEFIKSGGSAKCCTIAL